MHACGRRFDPPPLLSRTRDRSNTTSLLTYICIFETPLLASSGWPSSSRHISQNGYPLRNRKGAVMSSRGRFYRAHVPVPTLLPPSTNSYLRDLGDGRRREIRRSARVLSALTACGSHSHFGRRVLSLNLNRHNPRLDFNFVSTFSCVFLALMSYFICHGAVQGSPGSP